MHTSNLDEIALFIDDDGFESHVSDKFGETGYLMLNVAEGDNPTLGEPLDPAGANAEQPAAATCRAARRWRWRSTTSGSTRSATPAWRRSPTVRSRRARSATWRTPATRRSTRTAPQAEFETCLADAGTDKLTLSFNTTNDPFNVESNSLILSMWQEAFGDSIDATIEPIEQGQYIGLALAGDFQVFPWRSHSGSDPDQQRRWWSSATAQPIGTVGTNFGRFIDEVIDENLDIIRTNPDPDARREAAEAINRRFGEQVYNLWLNWALWGVITQPQVNGVENNVLPNGGDRPGRVLRWPPPDPADLVRRRRLRLSDGT